MNLLIVTTLFFTLCCSHVFAENVKQNFCQEDRCLTCIGRYCTTTCQGEGCKRCPLGECCDGTACNICRGEKCCSSADCNECIISCLKGCQGTSTCHYDCFQKCLPNGQNGNGNGEGNENQTNGGFSGPGIISNRNYFPVNVTTIINITNSIKNENFIHNPILINTTNVNNYTGHRNYHRKQVFISGSNPKDDNSTDVDLVPAEYKKNNCCEVIHPEICQKVKYLNDSLCFTKKHQECSALCSGKHIHIVNDPNGERKCISIVVQPLWYCGQYLAEKCDDCYECENTDQNECIQNEKCSDSCRSSIISEEFYNKLYRKDVSKK